MIRLRICFSKTTAMRYTSHLDLHRAWERTFRRAKLPLIYSQGFNPRPKLQLACALPLGFTSDCELLDVWLDLDDLADNIVQTNLEQAVPPGLRIHAITQIDLQSPALQVKVRSVGYNVTVLEPITDLDTRINGLIEAESVPRNRRGKLYDLRPLIEDIYPLPLDDEEHAGLFMQLVAQEGRTGRPEEVLEVLGISPLATRVHRTQLLLDEN
jgi:radical SAM-linked protein